MKRVVFSAVAALFFSGGSIGVTISQDAAASGEVGATCAQLNAMETASATAFLQGYQAGRMDAMSTSAPGGAMAAGGDAGREAAAGGDAPGGEAAPGGDAAGGAAAAGGEAAGAEAAAGGDAAGGEAAADGQASGEQGGVDAAAMIEACQNSPSSTLSDVMGGM